MNFKKIPIIILAVICMTTGCKKSVTPEQAQQTQQVPKDSLKILIDASKDGGVWWFPQSALFDSSADHQGKNLADYLRALGYKVDEVPRGAIITESLLSPYTKVIRAGGFGNYSSSEIAAYDNFLNQHNSLLLLQDHLLNFSNDNLSEHIGVQFRGIANGHVTNFEPHAITNGVTSLLYVAGSGVVNSGKNANMTILGYLEQDVYLDVNKNGQADAGDIWGPAVMGTINNYPCKIFFMGDVNGLESLPQPFTDNLIQWLFK